ncbi:MAG: trypsin-like peptidase domain-containing protein, partial [Rhodospirillaceae bacterium]|nr:trypsin-like peptidase domain-containing protein [Rhodospirillaceae bacterium]
SDRREFEAVIVGKDERTDLAVLKIKNAGKDFSFLELNNSDNLEVGDLVLAIGNPFGVGQTVTSGIVSALARTQIGVSDLGSFIQTDAAINPGNSGGALIGMDGKLIGINTAIFSKSGGSMGIGFAIPSNMVSSVVRAIQTGGRAVRPWFGASGHGVTADIARNIGLDRPVGVMITNVFDNGPAKRAGIIRGDVVLNMGGHEVQNPQDLRFRIATLSPGGSVDVSVWRNRKTQNISLPLEAPPEIPSKNETILKGRSPVAGALTANLSPALADELGLSMNNINGVIILKIIKNSNASRFGFASGDIFKEINGQSVSSVSGLMRILKTPSKLWRITIDRGGRKMSMAIKS